MIWVKAVRDFLQSRDSSSWQQVVAEAMPGKKEGQGAAHSSPGS